MEMKSNSASSPRQWSVAELGAFFVENRAEFLSHARRVVRISTEAEELVQDALVRVMLACPDLDSVEHARVYFHRVIENLGIDRLRQSNRQPRLIVLDDSTAELESRWRFDLDHSDVVAAADDAAIIREAIALLSPAERAALVMWEFEGRSTAEIARELGIKDSSVRHTLARARSALRRILAERVINEESGLTALDVLSVSLRKTKSIAHKSSRIALSLVLLFSAFLGLNSLVLGDLDVDELRAVEQESVADKKPNSNSETSGERRLNALTKEVGPEGSQQDLIVQSTEKSRVPSVAVNSGDSPFAGLDSDGIPSGFTISDSFGFVGTLFSGKQSVRLTETGLLVSNIVSTRSGATNVLIDQSVILDNEGTSYVAQVSVGISGGWQLLRLAYVSSDIERLASGNYLLTANMMVDSAVETSVKVSTGTSGTDLSSAPEFILTRVMLDPTKTKILAQAVLVSADSQGDGA